MQLSTFSVISTLNVVANADYCRYRIRSYSSPQCNNGAYHDAYLNSRDCFDLYNNLQNQVYYIWIDSLNGTDYCTQGNWIREYKNVIHTGSCSNNNRGQQNVEIGKCERLAHSDTDSIRINYA